MAAILRLTRGGLRSRQFLARLTIFGLLTVLLLWTRRLCCHSDHDASEPESLAVLGPEPPVARPGEVAVAVLASRRPEVQLLLRQLSARPDNFRLFVSQDGRDPVTSRTLGHFARVLTRLRFSGGADGGDSYARIALHHLLLLDFLFVRLGFRHVVVLEDDLLIAPDFYSYFAALRSVLDTDPSVFCASAWNDNGLDGLVEQDPTLLYRTDFFPGLGWMVNRTAWLRVRPVWPAARFDDFLRMYMLREGLVCLRPELSRTFNTGRCGGRDLVPGDDYGSLFHHRYLSRNVLCQQHVTIPSGAIVRLALGRKSDAEFQRRVLSLPEKQLSSLQAGPAEVRVRYSSAQEFVRIALQIGIIPEVWYGIPRCSLHGIVTVRLGAIRVFIAPDARLNLTDTVVRPTGEQLRYASWLGTAH